MRRRALIVYAGYVARIPGGVVNHIRHLQQGLRTEAWEVDVLSLESIRTPWRYLPHLIERIANAVYPPWGFYARYTVGRRLLKSAARGGGTASYDLVVFEDIYTAFPVGAPSLCVLHALISDNLQSVTLSPRRLHAARRYELALFRRMPCPVATVSREYRDALKQSFAQVLGDLPPLSVVAPSVDTSRYAFPPSPRPAGELRIVAIGYLYARKNFAFLADVLAPLAGRGDAFHLTVIGDGPQRAYLADLFSRMNLDRHVTWAGLVPSEQMPEVLPSFHLMLHPSLKESFAYALLEAKLAGVYTMTSPLDVPAEFCDDILPLEASVWASRLHDKRGDLLSGRWLEESLPRLGDLRRKYSIDRMTKEVLELSGISGEEGQR